MIRLLCASFLPVPNLLLVELMDVSAYSKPLSFSYREQTILFKSDLLGVLGLAMGYVHLPHTFQNCHTPFQHFISPFFSSKTPQPTSCSSSEHHVLVSCSRLVLPISPKWYTGLTLNFLSMFPSSLCTSP